MGALSTYQFINGKAVIEKDPNEVLDYSFNWGQVMDAISDEIANVEFIVDQPLEIESHDFNERAAVVWISGGGAVTMPATRLQVTCRVTTKNKPPRVYDQSIYLKIVNN